MKIDSIHNIYKNDRLLIFQPDADFLFLPGYEFRPTTQISETILNASNFGKITSGLRLMSIDMGDSTENFIMVPKTWENPTSKFESVGVFNNNFEIEYPCDINACENAVFYLVPVKELNAQKGGVDCRSQSRHPPTVISLCYIDLHPYRSGTKTYSPIALN